jgi:uncharacterized protein YjiS (DUF1127 family)
MSAIAHPGLTDCQVSIRSSPAYAKRRPGWASRTLATWQNRIAERQAFASLEYRDLRDMGLSRWDVEREVAKPFWRA